MRKRGFIVVLDDELAKEAVDALREAIKPMPGVFGVFGPHIGTIDECPECEAESKE